MRKIASIFLSLLLLWVCFGCHDKNPLPIENYKWEMTTIQSSEFNENPIVYNPTVAMDFNYNRVQGCKPMAMTCHASDGKIVIFDKTDNTIYNGTYTLTEKKSNSTIYEISFAQKTGTAVTSMKTYSDGTKTPTLIISLGLYTLNFIETPKNPDAEIGVIFQVTSPLDETLQIQKFDNSNDLSTYIENQSFYYKYFYLLEDNGYTEVNSNFTRNADPPYFYVENVKIPENWWLVVHKIYKSDDNHYYISPNVPQVVDTQISNHYAFGKNPSPYVLQVTLTPHHVPSVQETLMYTGMPAALTLCSVTPCDVTMNKNGNDIDIRLAYEINESMENAVYIDILSSYFDREYDLERYKLNNLNPEYMEKATTLEKNGIFFDLYHQKYIPEKPQDHKTVQIFACYTAQSGETCFSEIIIDYIGNATWESISVNILENISVIYHL